MFKLRFATASILSLLFIISLAYLSTTNFVIFIMLVVLIAGWEWCDLSGIKSIFTKLLYILVLLGSLLIASNYVGIYSQFNQVLSYQICFSVMLLWAIIFLWLQGYPSSAILWSSKAVMLCLGVIILVATWVALASIMSLENGRYLLILAVTIIVLADVGGYAAGKLFGRHKLAPTISPGKTWEGLIGGMFLQAFLVGILLQLFPEKDALELCILVFPVAICSVIGDLFESMLKRFRGVKDSSNLLPGHGGFLDRLDGFMAALPMFYLILSKTNPF